MKYYSHICDKMGYMIFAYAQPYDIKAVISSGYFSAQKRKALQWQRH